MGALSRLYARVKLVSSGKAPLLPHSAGSLPVNWHWSRLLSRGRVRLHSGAACGMP